MKFHDRADAGRQLGRRLLDEFGTAPDVVVVGLPRGGVPVAREVAQTLGAPLDVLLVRKLGFPGHPELGMGAIGEGNVRVLDTNLIVRAGISQQTVEAVTAAERVELARRARLYRSTRPPLTLTHETALIVDDGLATGGTARAAIAVARAMGAARVVVAVPVAPADTVAMLEAEADAVVVLKVPANFRAVGEWYDDFTQTTDAEVISAMATSPRSDGPEAQPPAARPSVSRSVGISIGPITVEGTLDVPPDARGLIVFAHGSGSSRHSPRNRAVARRLQQAGFATLLFDLMTEAEAQDRALVFDTEFLAERLLHVTRWARTDPDLSTLPLGLFGASTGAGAALRVAARADVFVRAVVSRGGRPDLAAEQLDAVRCPTLLIVGGADLPTREVNEAAAARLRCPHEMAIIRGATHLFEEPGALESVAQLAADWFEFHLGDSHPASHSRTTSAS